MAYDLNLSELAKKLKGKPPREADKLRGQAELFWQRQISNDIQAYTDSPLHRARAQEPTGELAPAPLSILATAAYGMLHVLSLGGWQGTRVVETEKAKAPATALASPPGPLSFVDPRSGDLERGRMRRLMLASEWDALNKALGKLAREQTGDIDLPQFIAEQLKFPASFARTFGIQPQYAALYIEERMPPIVDATLELQAGVRDAVGAAAQTAWDPEALSDELQRVSNVTQSRAQNQMRTESSTLFTRGRMEAFEEDDSIIGYRFIVTDDARTTDICRAHIGVVVPRDGLQSIPPFHYQCRTQIVPIFRWQASRYPGLELGTQPGVLEGFGQGDWLRAKRGV